MNRYTCYDRLIRLINDINLFEKGDIFNRNTFKDKLCNKQALPTFNYIYWTDTCSSGRWTMFDFSDRFKKFADWLCEIGFCSKIKSGTYIKI